MSYVPSCPGDFELIEKYKRQGLTEREALDVFDDFMTDMEADLQLSEEIEINEEDL